MIEADYNNIPEEIQKDASLYEAYMRGFDNTAINFGYIPDEYTKEQMLAYAKGVVAGLKKLEARNYKDLLTK